MLSKMISLSAIASISLMLMTCTVSKYSADSDDLQFPEIDTFLRSYSDSSGIPGIAVAITKGPNMLYMKCLGVTSIVTKQKLEPRHIFHIASISKTFAATAVMQIFEKGKIDINKTLVSYLPYFKLGDERYQKITIKQMLNHTSGIPDVEDYEWEKATSDAGAAERYTRSLAGIKLISEPGTEFHYSNMAFDLFADLVEKVSGMTFEKYVKENILDPLEMFQSSFYLPDINQSLRTSPHFGNPPVMSEIYPYNRMHAPSSTLNTNILELSNWAIANMYNGNYKGKQILSPATHSLMMKPTFLVNDSEKISIGLSWFIYPYKGVTNYEHSGSDLGYRSILTLIPEQKLGIIILSNFQQIRINEVRNKLRDILLNRYRMP